MHALARLEETSISIWLRESGLAFFSALTLHSLAMALVVGINLALALRLAGLVPAFTLRRFRPFLTLHWVAAAVVTASGLALLLAYPAKALTNSVYYLKLVALATGFGLTFRAQRNLDSDSATIMTASGAALIPWIMIIAWVVTLTAGRFLAYTNSVLLASRFY